MLNSVLSATGRQVALVRPFGTFRRLRTTKLRPRGRCPLVRLRAALHAMMHGLPFGQIAGCLRPDWHDGDEFVQPFYPAMSSSGCAATFCWCSQARPF